MHPIIFGPITSRRFGQSLGIDLSPHSKQCNFNCLYCELKGAKTVSSAQNVPTCNEVLEALKEALLVHNTLDVITLTANGEPTLYPEFEKLIHEIRALQTGVKLLVLSNGSTIAHHKVQHALMQVDIVKLSLDCATPSCFKKLDRPHASVSLSAIIDGMKHFRRIFKNELVIEILVVDGLNDTEEEFEALNRILQEVQPNRIDVGTIDRPPAYDVKGVSVERLKVLADKLKGLHVNIAYKKEYSATKRHFSETEILGLLERRPQSEEDIRFAFDDASSELLMHFVTQNKVVVKKVAGVVFYSRAG